LPFAGYGQYESSVPNKIVAFFADIFNDGNDEMKEHITATRNENGKMNFLLKLK
jgi:hypothetical protein